MAKRKNNEGSYDEVKRGEHVYKRYRDAEIGTVYAKTSKELQRKIKEKREKGASKKTEKNLRESNLSTFSDLCDLWLPTVYSDISARTYDDYESIVEKRIKEYRAYDIANKQIKALDPQMFTLYFASMAEKYSSASIHKTWVVIQLVLKYGIKKNLIRKSFELDEIKRPSESRVAKKKKDVPFITLEDMDLLYDELMSGKYGNAARMLIFIMYSGVRVSEATALTWENVSEEFDSVKIRSASSRVVERDAELKPIKNEDGTIRHKSVKKSPKTEDGVRTIPLPSRAIEVLKYFDSLREHNDNDFVFVTSNNTPIAADNTRHCLSRALKNSKCKCKTYSPHSLRHGYGSVLISKGVDIKMVSELLGHSDVAFTYNTYIGILNDDKIKEVKRVFG